MKKTLSIFIIILLFLQNISFADFNIETKVPVQKQESYKKQIDTVYKGFENKLSKLNEEKQIISIEKIILKIENIVKNKISDKNDFVLSYLNYLLKEKLDFLKNNDEKLNLGEILKIEEKNDNIKNEIISDTCNSGYHSELGNCIKNIKSCSILNGNGEQNWDGEKWNNCNILSCNTGYNYQNGTCIKNQETSINVNVNNQVTTRSCYIDNGQGQETYSNNVWGTCNIVSCNNSYHKEGNSCISNQQSCNIDNGNGYKNWNGTWSNCNISTCNSGFESQNLKCLKSCTSTEHREGEFCISNKVACDIENGKGEKEWKNGSWGYCRTSGCNDGYNVGTNSNKCEKFYTNIKVIKNTSTISELNMKIGEFYIDASSFLRINDGGICFKEINNTNLLGSIIIEDNSGYMIASPRFLYTYNKICVSRLISNFSINNKYSILLAHLNESDLGKIPVFVLDKDSFKIVSSTSSEEYNINDINYSEE